MPFAARRSTDSTQCNAGWTLYGEPHTNQYHKPPPPHTQKQTSVFVGSGAGLIAFDVLEGKPTWLSPGVKLAPLSRPAVGQGASCALVGCSEPSVDAGHPQAKPNQTKPSHAPPQKTTTAGLIFVHTAGGNLTAFDGASGKQAWTQAIPGAGGSTPVVRFVGLLVGWLD